MMTLASLASLLNAQLIGDDIQVSNISTDTRAINPGDLYIALRGERFDGHEFVVEAIGKGAGAVVVDAIQRGLAAPQLVVDDTLVALGQIAAQRRKDFDGEVIAVTGSSGKTSVKGMLRDILSEAFDVVVTPGNFNNQVGVPLSLLRLANQQRAVIEVGTNHPGEISYLTALVQPDIALVNNVMPAHIGGFGSLSAIAKEKCAIYSTLTNDQCAVINADDQFCQLFETATEHCSKLGFSVAGATKDYPVLYANNVHLEQGGGAYFDLCWQQKVVAVQLQVPGLHSVNNALAAAACSLAAGCTLTQVAEGLAKFLGEKGRMQRKAGLRGACIIDDTYNANPGSVRAAVDYLSTCNGKKILVLGDLAELGEIAEQVHHDLGAYAQQQKIDALYAYGRHAQSATAGFGGGAVACRSKQYLIEQLQKIADSETTVLIKGSRSARMEEVVWPLEQTAGGASC